MTPGYAGSDRPEETEGEAKRGLERFLASVPLFRGMTGSDVSVLAAHCLDARFPADTPVFEEGDAGDALFVLREGLVKLVARSRQGAETILLLLHPGEVFGELLFSEGRRIFTAAAVTPARAVGIPRGRFLRLLMSRPAVGLSVIRVMSERLARLGRGVAAISHAGADRRLAEALLRLAEICGREIPEGTLLDLPLTHRDLANLIGTTRETVTIQLNRFYRRGLASRRGRRLIARCGPLAEFLRSAGRGFPPAIGESA